MELFKDLYKSQQVRIEKSLLAQIFWCKSNYKHNKYNSIFKELAHVFPVTFDKLCTHLFTIVKHRELYYMNILYLICNMNNTKGQKLKTS